MTVYIYFFTFYKLYSRMNMYMIYMYSFLICLMASFIVKYLSLFADRQCFFLLFQIVHVLQADVLWSMGHTGIERKF